jgi:hypothetical protein
MGLIATMDSVTFYIVAQGLLHKNGICQIIFGNTSLSWSHVLLVAEMFCHLHHNPNLKKLKRKKCW